MAWFYLFVAGIIEVGWAIGLKYSNGLSLARPWVTGGTLAGMLASFAFLSLAMKSLPLGTAYAVWTGIGAVGTTLFGIFYLGEPRDLPRLLCIALIVCGLVGLKWLSAD